VCSVCKEPLSGPSYSCTSCNFFLHSTFICLSISITYIFGSFDLASI
jgi:hypothetical protein